eukprot:SAG31_NODE_1158_length_9605_cov_2.788555_17_plen_69_part_00
MQARELVLAQRERYVAPCRIAQPMCRTKVRVAGVVADGVASRDTSPSHLHRQKHALCVSRRILVSNDK